MKDMDVINQYSRQVFYSERDEGFIALCPEFPGLSAFGETVEDALNELDVALELGIETYQEEGWPLPEPANLPSTKLPSGEFRVRLPKSLHARLARQAKLDGVSQNALLVSYVSQGLKGTEIQSAIRKEVSQLVGHVGKVAGAFRDLVNLHSSNTASRNMQVTTYGVAGQGAFGNMQLDVAAERSQTGKRTFSPHIGERHVHRERTS
ncbi:MAG: type II toxin-antitoxin system HicB family antitoxin [Trueperaceae bacterium]